LRIPAVHAAFARQVREPAEYHGEYHHCQERPDDCPSNADDGLLIRPSLIVVEKVHSDDDDAFGRIDGEIDRHQAASTR
jgi:hypothetical protein